MSMISNTSPRLPQKTCGLFDTGLAGDAAVVASLPALQANQEPSVKVEVLDPAAAAVEGLKSWAIGLCPDPAAVGQGKEAEVSQAPLNFLSGGDAFIAAEGNQLVSNDNDGLEDWGLDFLDPLGGLDDPAMDAFMDLGPLLGNNLLDVVPEAAEPAPVLPSQPEQQGYQFAEVEPVIQFSTVHEPAFTAVTEPVIKAEPEPVSKAKGRKRKRQSSNESKAPATKVKKVAAATVESQDPSFDHDYVSQSTSSGRADNMDKQTARRIKNNIASKRSREQRKQKFAEMDDEAEKLEIENERLRIKIVELEKMAKEMKAVLVAKMAGKC